MQSSELKQTPKQYVDSLPTSGERIYAAFLAAHFHGHCEKPQTPENVRPARATVIEATLREMIGAPSLKVR